MYKLVKAGVVDSPHDRGVDAVKELARLVPTRLYDNQRNALYFRRLSYLEEVPDSYSRSASEW